MRLIIMGKGKGHETVECDTPRAIREAEEILQRELRRGGTAFSVNPATGETKPAVGIDPKADTYIVLPLRGG